MDYSDGWIVFLRRFSFADGKLYSKAGVQFFFNVFENLAFYNISCASEAVYSGTLKALKCSFYKSDI